MRKNNKLINQMRMLAEINTANACNKASDIMVPEIYASVALALNDVCQFDYDQINEVFCKSQHIWEQFEGKPDDMIKLCEEKTGICVKKGGD